VIVKPLPSDFTTSRARRSTEIRMSRKRLRDGLSHEPEACRQPIAPGLVPNAGSLSQSLLAGRLLSSEGVGVRL
jgi:hypothetical protein